VEWTPTAKRALADKEFRYFSPEFVDSWKRPSDGKVFQDVLFGGALTNRPFLKEIQPINLSDFGLEPEGDDVEELLKALAEALGLKELSDDSTKAQTAIVDAIQSLSEKAKTPPAPKTEDDDKLKKLSESDPLIAQLLSDREVDRKRLNLLEASNKLSEVTRKLSDVNTPKSALPPAFADVMRDVLVKLSDKDNSTVIEALKQLNETGLVTLGELGGKNSKERQQSDKGDAIKSFNDGVAKIVKEDKVSYREATERFSDAEPALWAAYNEAQLQKVD
jgi:predicted Zn-dependent protease with MMP-like domain